MRRREKHLPSGHLLIDDTAPTFADALELARGIARACPDDHHPWRVQIQKSDRGRRCSVRVWLAPNART